MWKSDFHTFYLNFTKKKLIFHCLEQSSSLFFFWFVYLESKCMCSWEIKTIITVSEKSRNYIEWQFLKGNKWQCFQFLSAVLKKPERNVDRVLQIYLIFSCFTGAWRRPSRRDIVKDSESRDLRRTQKWDWNQRRKNLACNDSQAQSYLFCSAVYGFPLGYWHF